MGNLFYPMNKHYLTLLLALCPLFSFAQAPVSRTDVEELRTVMRVEKTMQTAMEQVKKMATSQVARSLTGQTSPDDAQKVQAIQDKIFALIQDEMNWQKIKDDCGRIYAESLTPEEIKGIIAFYKSPVGQAYLDKQPVVLQKTMAMQQKMMMGLMPKIQTIIQSAEMQPSQ